VVSVETSDGALGTNPINPSGASLGYNVYMAIVMVFRYGSFLLAFLTTAIIAVRARTLGKSLNRGLRSYGTAACVSALTAVAFFFVVSLLDVAVRLPFDPADQAWFPLQTAILRFGAYGGCSVASIWTVLLLSGSPVES
jgi:hypothetical protein